MAPCLRGLDFWFDFASTYSYPAAMRIGPLAEASRRRGALSPVPARADLQGAGLDHVAVQSLSRQGPPHVARSRAAVRRLWRCRSGAPIRFRRTACWPPASRSPGSTTTGAKTSAARVPRRNSATAGRSTTPRRSAMCWRACRSIPAGARGRPIGRDQDAAAGADRGGAAARPVRRAELHHRRRRIVLGQRPARAGAALGEARP